MKSNQPGDHLARRRHLQFSHEASSVCLYRSMADLQAAVYAACDAIEAGRARIALVVGAEKMTGIGAAEVTRVLGNASYVKEEAGDLQVSGAELAGVFNMGGSAVASYVSILERTR